MADPYRSYFPSSSSFNRVPLGDIPGYFPPGESYYASRMAALRSDIPINDVPLHLRAYGLEAPAGVSHPALAGLSALPTGVRAQGPIPMEGPSLISRGSPPGKYAGAPHVEHPINVHPKTLVNTDGPSEDESNILYVDGLPSDCTRREVAHLFRPFAGFKDLRLVHKEPRRSGDKAYVLCFVEFDDAKCAMTAIEALQGYCFDERKPDGPVLKIQFARFPFRLPAGAHDDQSRPTSR